MSGQLSLKMMPIVDESLADVCAAKSYDDAMKRYNSVPFVPKVESDLSDYVVEKGFCGNTTNQTALLSCDTFGASFLSNRIRSLNVKFDFSSEKTILVVVSPHFCSERLGNGLCFSKPDCTRTPGTDDGRCGNPRGHG